MKASAGCAENRRLDQLTRRRALQVGFLGGMGLSLTHLLRSQAQAATAGARAKSVILLWLQGGVSHHDTFDMKLDAASDVRGELSPISTSLPGEVVSEYLPRTAQLMHKVTLIRSMTHGEAAHQRGAMYMVEGRRPPKATGVFHSGHPEMGSIVGHELGMQHGMPAFVSNPGNDFTSKFTGPGFLPQASEAFRGFNARTLSMPDNFSAERFQGRLALRQSIENIQQQSHARGRSWDRFTEQAIDIVNSARAAEAFDYQKESPETLRDYGIQDAAGQRIRGEMGQLTLTARRLVEAGVRFVTVGRASWDHHSSIFPQLRGRLPRVDAAFAALVNDLEQRGRLDETLVILASEFGRTPKINASAGRDHWPRAFSVVMAGAGIPPGQILGASDKIGGDVADQPVSPEELMATILHLVGIPPHSTYIGQDSRPLRYVDEAEPVAALLG